MLKLLLRGFRKHKFDYDDVIKEEWTGKYQILDGWKDVIWYHFRCTECSEIFTTTKRRNGLIDETGCIR